MTGEYLGRKCVDFTPEGKERIQGLRLYYAVEEDGVEGLACDSTFLPSDFPLPEGLRPHQAIELYFTRKGKVGKVEVIASAKQINLGKQ